MCDLVKKWIHIALAKVQTNQPLQVQVFLRQLPQLVHCLETWLYNQKSIFQFFRMVQGMWVFHWPFHCFDRFEQVFIRRAKASLLDNMGEKRTSSTDKLVANHQRELRSCFGPFYENDAARSHSFYCQFRCNKKRKRSVLEKTFRNCREKGCISWKFQCWLTLVRLYLRFLSHWTSQLGKKIRRNTFQYIRVQTYRELWGLETFCWKKATALQVESLKVQMSTTANTFVGHIAKNTPSLRLSKNLCFFAWKKKRVR